MPRGRGYWGAFGPAAHYAKRHDQEEVDNHHAQGKPSAAGDSGALHFYSDHSRAEGNTGELCARHCNCESLINCDHDGPAIGLREIPEN